MNESPRLQAKRRKAAKSAVAPGRLAEPRPVKAEPSQLPAPLRAIGNEHRYISRLLLILEDEAEALRKSGDCDYETLHRVVDYLWRFPDRYHHPKEDLIFDRMRDPAHADIIAELRQSHTDIAEVNRKLLQAISDQLCVPTRSRARELQRQLHDYCTNQRKHMRLEEGRIFAPALAQLSSADWAEIDQLIAPVVDPIFGAEKASKYRRLFNRHVDRVVTVASGAVPTGMLEVAAVGTERMVHTAVHLGRLPSKLLETGRASFMAQMRSLTELAHARDIASLTRSTEDYLKTFADAGRSFATQIQDAFLANDSGAEAPTGEPVELRSADDISAFEQRPYTPTCAAKVSWQASVSNVLFRLVVKPLVSQVGIDHAEKLKRLMQSNGDAPFWVKSSAVAGKDFKALWIESSKGVRGKQTILYLPGGGFFFPATNGHTRLLAQLVRDSGCRGMLVNYRLAPEHPFPAGLDDAMAAYRYLLDTGVSSDEIVVAGDSAGGGLALSLLLSIRDAGLPMPAAGAIISALADLSFSTPSRKLNKWRDPLLPNKRELQVYRLYTGNTPLNDPLLSPIYGNFQGLPPIFAQVGSTEVLLDDTLQIARKARLQGVDFELEIWDGLPHAWHVFSWIPESKKALTRIAEFFRMRLDLLADLSANAPKVPRASNSSAPRRRRSPGARPKAP
jgi:monoterpene epsilon-lactone hydrolase